MAVEASVIVVLETKDEDSASIVVELDDGYADNLDIDGNLKSQFLPEETPVFLIEHGPEIEITDVRCTDGRVDSIGTNQDRNRITEVLFTTEKTKEQLQYSTIVFNDISWFGNIGIPYQDGNTIRVEADSAFPCFGECHYTVLFNRQYKLTPPPLILEEDETYKIYVVIYAREIDL